MNIKCTDSDNPLVYPVDWYDDKKMNVMIAPLRDKTRFPQAWNQKMTFWLSVLNTIIDHENKLVISKELLRSKIKRKNQYPACFDDALKELIQKGELQKFEDFKFWYQEVGWLSWSYDIFVKKPFHWSLSKIWKDYNKNDNSVFISTTVLKKKCEEVMKTVQQATSKGRYSSGLIFEYETLQSHLSRLLHDPPEFDLIISKLVSDHLVDLRHMNDGRVLLKFARNGQKQTDNISEMDEYIFKIERSVTLLEKEINELSLSAERFTSDAKDYVKRGLRTSAYYALKKRRKTRRLISRKYNIIENLVNLLERIQSSASDKMVFEALNAASSALNLQLKDRSLTLDNIDKLLDDLDQAKEDQDAISDTLASYSDDQTLTTNDDLEEELNRILDESKEMNELSEQVDSVSLVDIDQFLPEVPASSVPSISKDEANCDTRRLLESPTLL